MDELVRGANPRRTPSDCLDAFWSLEADPDESVRSLWPVACFIDGGVRPKVLVVAQDVRLADLLNVKGKTFAPRKMIAAGSKLP